MNVLLLAGDLRVPSELQGELLRKGHQLDRTARVEDALERVRTRRTDAVLLDLGLGEGLIDRLRDLAPRLPVIALGEDERAQAAAGAFAQGAFGYVPVPRRDLGQEGMTQLEAMVERAASRARVEAARREALEENLRTRKFYEDVLTGVGQGIVVVDPDARIRFLNPEAARILGEEDQSTSALAGQAAVPLLQQLVDTLAERKARSSVIALDMDDERVSLDVTTSLLRSAEGDVAGAIAIVSDRSTEKRLEEQLIHSERLATLGSLLASIAHEIQNTLGSITTCAEMGLDVANAADDAAQSADPGAAPAALQRLSQEIREIFDMVLQAGTSAQTIANNMLQYSRQGIRGNAVRQDLNQLVRMTLSALGKHLGVDKVSLHLGLDPSAPHVKVEPAKIQQALVNLVVNAVHALQEVPEERRILRVETEVDQGAHDVLLHVRDRGPGISSRRLERIWQSFFTTKKHGTGLGLYITRTVVEDQGGRISVQSTPGEGTTFSIRLPLAD